MSPWESRLGQLEYRFEMLLRRFDELTIATRAAEQLAHGAYDQYPTSGTSSGGATVFFADPGANVVTTIFPANPNATTGNIYTVTSGVMTVVETGATIYGVLSDRWTVGAAPIAVGKNSDGTYSAISNGYQFSPDHA